MELTQETYEFIKLNHETFASEINEIYKLWNNYSYEEKSYFLERIKFMRQFMEEAQKYMAVYESSVQEVTQDYFSYVVTQQDTLPGIAARFYEGEFQKWKDIYDYNVLSDIKLYPGQVLKIRTTD